MSSELRDTLKKRLDENYAAFIKSLQKKTVSELIALAPEITAAQQLRDELACACSEEDAATLLQFDDPLEEMRGFWATEQDGCHSEEIGHMIGELQCRGEFPAPPPIKAVQKETKTAPHRPKRDQER